jgi:phage-related tail protein
VTTALVKAEPVLDEVFAVVRAKLRDVQAAGAALLHSAMAVGDALNLAEIQIKQRGGNWKRALRDNCFLNVRTAFVYQQLARHRAELEEAIERAGDLSLRAALRLISTPKKISSSSTNGANAPEPEESLASHWKRAGTEARTAFLDAIGIDGILGAMSAEFGRELRDRVPAPKRKSGKPYTKTLNLSANRAHGRAHSSQH